MLTTVPAIYWLAMQQPEFADTDTSGVLALSYGGAPIAPALVARDPVEVPGRPRRQRLRPDRDVLGRDLPAGRVRRGARRLGRLPGPGVRGRPVRPGPRYRRRRTADPGAERRRGLLAEAGADGRDVRRRLAALRRPRPHRRRRAGAHRRPQEGHDQPRRRERVLRRGGERAGATARGRGGVGGRRARLDDGREGRRRRRAAARRSDLDPAASWPSPASTSPTSRCRSTSPCAREPLPRNPGGKVLKPVLRKETEWGQPLR